VWHAELAGALAVLIADDVTQMSENVVMLDDSRTDNIAIPSFMVRKSVFDTIKNESMATISIISQVQKQDKPKLNIWIAQGSSLKLNQLSSIADHLASISQYLTVEINLIAQECQKCTPPSECLEQTSFCPIDQLYSSTLMREVINQKCILTEFGFATWAQYALEASK
jgi:hypothetical protein